MKNVAKTKGNKDWLRSWQHCRRVYPEMPTTVPLALPSFVSLTHPTVQLCMKVKIGVASGCKVKTVMFLLGK